MLRPGPLHLPRKATVCPHYGLQEHCVSLHYRFLSSPHFYVNIRCSPLPGKLRVSARLLGAQSDALEIQPRTRQARCLPSGMVQWNGHAGHGSEGSRRENITVLTGGPAQIQLVTPHRPFPCAPYLSLLPHFPTNQNVYCCFSEGCRDQTYAPQRREGGGLAV